MFHSSRDRIAPAQASRRSSRDPSDDVLSALRHELRGPLSALLAAVEVLDIAPPDGPDAAMAREVVRRQARRLSGLVDELTRPTTALPAAAPAPVRAAAGRKLLLLLREATAGPLARALQEEGHQVHVASDGIAGLRRLLELQPDVSLIDVGLPGLTGLEVARHARAAGHAGRLVALVDAASCDLRRIESSGFDAWLAQPPDLAELRASLQRPYGA